MMLLEIQNERTFLDNYTNDAMKMLTYFRNLNISKKLLIIMSVSSMFAVSLSVLILSVFDFIGAKKEFEQKVTVSSEVMARNTVVALSFSDAPVANENLSSLSADDTIAAAAVFDADNNLFASYLRSQRQASLIPRTIEPKKDAVWSRKHLEVFVPLLNTENERLGHLVVWADTAPLYDGLVNAMLTSVLLLITLGILSLLLSGLFQGLISAPILDLLKLTVQVTEKKDYSIRAQPNSLDEVGRLAKGFNSMLATIESSNAKLADHRARLEVEVLERTEDLQSKEAHMRAILESAGDGILTVSHEGEILSANPTAVRMLGGKSTVLGTQFSDHLVGKDLEERIRLFQGIIGVATSETPTAEVEIQSSHGIFPASISVGAIERIDQKLYIFIVSDVTRFRQAEEMLRESRDAAYAASKAKSEFLANMSHEIRTPMNAIIGMSELCLETRLSSVQHDYISTVLDSAKALLSLLNDILDFSKIEAGKFKIHNEDFNIREMVVATIRTLTSRFRGTEVELICDVDPSLDSWYQGDPGRIRQVLVNLIGNAAKFTHEGEVVLSVRKGNVLEDGSGNEVIFSVKDTGIGIPEEKQSNIFEAFNQADSSTTRLYGGTGLGLTISNQLLSLMNGSMSFESTFGIGSTFTVTVPLAECARPEAEIVPCSLESIKGLRALVVDDNETNRTILVRTLERELDLEVTSVESGQHALSLLGRSASAKPEFDIIITDFQMPFMDGEELINRLRRLPAGKEIPIVVLSSVDLRLSEDKFRHLGVRTTLLKPVLSESLIDGIQAALGKGELDVNNLRPMIAHQLRGRLLRANYSLDILVVEDNRVNQKLVKQILKKRGHTVTMAENGQVALAILEERGLLSDAPLSSEEVSPFDLVLMDIQMPIMGGVEATVRIRKAEKGTGRHLPIVALTAHAFDEQRKEYLDSGMDHYLTKPLDTSQLETILDIYGEKKETVNTIEEEQNPQVKMLEAVDGNIDLLVEILTELYEALGEEFEKSTQSEIARFRSTSDTIDAINLIRHVDGDFSILIESVRDLCAEWATARYGLEVSLRNSEKESALDILSLLQAMIEALCAPYALSACNALQQVVFDNNFSEAQYYFRLLEAEIDLIVPAFQSVLQKQSKSLPKGEEAR